MMRGRGENKRQLLDICWSKKINWRDNAAEKMREGGVECKKKKTVWDVTKVSKIKFFFN